MEANGKKLWDLIERVAHVQGAVGVWWPIVEGEPLPVALQQPLVDPLPLPECLQLRLPNRRVACWLPLHLNCNPHWGGCNPRNAQHKKKGKKSLWQNEKQKKAKKRFVFPSHPHLPATGRRRRADGGQAGPEVEGGLGQQHSVCVL